MPEPSKVYDQDGIRCFFRVPVEDPDFIEKMRLYRTARLKTIRARPRGGGPTREPFGGMPREDAKWWAIYFDEQDSPAEKYWRGEFNRLDTLHIKTSRYLAEARESLYEKREMVEFLRSLRDKDSREMGRLRRVNTEEAKTMRHNLDVMIAEHKAEIARLRRQGIATFVVCAVCVLAASLIVYVKFT